MIDTESKDAKHLKKECQEYESESSSSSSYISTSDSNTESELESESESESDSECGTESKTPLFFETGHKKCSLCTARPMDKESFIEFLRVRLPVDDLWAVCHRCRFSGFQGSRVSPQTPLVPIKSRTTDEPIFETVSDFVCAFKQIIMETAPGIVLPL